MTTIVNTWSLCACPNCSRNIDASPVPPQKASGLRFGFLRGLPLPATNGCRAFASVKLLYSSVRLESFLYVSRSTHISPKPLKSNVIRGKTRSVRSGKNQNNVRNVSNSALRPQSQLLATAQNPAHYSTLPYVSLYHHTLPYAKVRVQTLIYPLVNTAISETSDFFYRSSHRPLQALYVSGSIVLVTLPPLTMAPKTWLDLKKCSSLKMEKRAAEFFQVCSVARHMFKAKLAIGIGAMILLAGCVSAPPPAEQTVSAYSVGDRGKVIFDEVVVSLSLRTADGIWVPGYQNLHVVPGALVNERRAAVPARGYGSSSGYTPSSANEVEGILQRLELRVNAKLTEVLSKLPPQSLADAEKLRAVVVKEAQTVVDEGMVQWEHGKDYKVEMVVVSQYWTDSSVGRSAQQRGRWF